jgi:toxin YoeB
MNKLFTDEGWEDYIYWLSEDKKTLKRVNDLLKDIDRNGNDGIGKPEHLKGDKHGYWSRRINEKDRLVYKIKDNAIIIIACRTHYGDK